MERSESKNVLCATTQNECIFSDMYVKVSIHIFLMFLSRTVLRKIKLRLWLVTELFSNVTYLQFCFINYHAQCVFVLNNIFWSPLYSRYHSQRISHFRSGVKKPPPQITILSCALSSCCLSTFFPDRTGAWVHYSVSFGKWWRQQNWMR
jgi:hypothetical protein